MKRCELCKSNDFVKAIVTKTGREVVVCQECFLIYDVDKNGEAVFGHDPKDIPYFKALKDSFKTWDELSNITPYVAE